MLIDNFEHIVLKPMDVVFEEGALGSNFYIVISGMVEFRAHNKILRTAQKGNMFGEVALIDLAPRTASVAAMKQTELWSLSSITYKRVNSRVNKNYYAENTTFIESIPLFKHLSEPEKHALANAFNVHEYADGHTIISEGEIGDLFYIIKEGTVMCTNSDGVEIRRMGHGEYFGEQALIYECPRTATIRTFGECTCLSLSRDNLFKVLGANLEQVVFQNTMRMILEKSEHLNVLLDEQISKIAKAVDVKEFKADEIIVRAGTPIGQRLWLVVKGHLKGFEHSHVSIGDDAFALKTGGVFTEDVVAQKDSFVGVISIEKFEEIIGGDLRMVLEGNELMKALKKVPLLRNLATSVLTSISGNVKPLRFDSGEAIVTEGEEGNTFYVIKEG